MTLAKAVEIQEAPSEPSTGRPVRGISGRAAKWIGLGIGALLAVSLIALPVLPLPSPNLQDLLHPLEGPSGSHWLGTDEVGRDALSRLLYGARTTLLAALFATAICAVIGLPLGLLAGRLGGTFDSIASRAADAIMAVPPLILLMAVIAALGQGVWKSMAVLGIILAPRLFRVTRAATINLSAAEFITVGEMSGIGRGRLLSQYILRNIRAQVVVQLTVLLGYAILTEASISFLGLGVTPPNPSLGVLLRSSMEFLAAAPLLVIAPGILISAVILACNLAGDSLSNRGGVK